MRIQITVPEEHVQPDVVEPVLEAVTRLDEHMIRTGQTPSSRTLVEKGAIWRPEPPGQEHFDHGGTIAARGWGDCDDWAPLHAATLRAEGTDPGARAVLLPSGPSTFHATVLRSDGTLDDPSVAAGMKPNRSIGGPSDAIDVLACDPHDGRVYQGSLLPTVAPLSLHCGPTFSVRGATVVGAGNIYQGRCDLPIGGSPLVHVRSFLRRRPRRVHGIPYAISCTGYGISPVHALNSAVVGAILCGDAAEMTTSLDRYKLLAVQAALAGHTPGQVREQLVWQIRHDIEKHAKDTGTHPHQHTQALLHELAIHGCGSSYVVGGFFDDIGKIATGVVHAVSDVANTVAKVVTAVPWGDIIHDAQAVVSLVPGLGTAVSEVVATAESVYDSVAATLSGHPLEGAIHAAYNYALASVPGAAALHPILDPVLNTILALVVKGEPVDSALVDGILSGLPDSPRFGPISPRSIAASLVHMLVGHLGVRNTSGKPTPKPAPPPLHAAVPFHAAIPMPHPAMHPLHAARGRPTAPRPVARPVVRAKPKGVPHAAVHVTHAAAHTPPAVPVARAMPRPGSPGAPPGATHWQCHPLPGGAYACRWV